eukprot:356704-Chlamydomonas_euryale.AAC.15
MHPRFADCTPEGARQPVSTPGACCAAPLKEVTPSTSFAHLKALRSAPAARIGLAAGTSGRRPLEATCQNTKISAICDSASAGATRRGQAGQPPKAHLAAAPPAGTDSGVKLHGDEVLARKRTSAGATPLFGRWSKRSSLSLSTPGLPCAGGAYGMEGLCHHGPFLESKRAPLHTSRVVTDRIAIAPGTHVRGTTSFCAGNSASVQECVHAATGSIRPGLQGAPP